MMIQRRFRIGAIHALANAIPTTQAAFDRVWPEADVAHLLDGSLYLDRDLGTADEEELTARIENLFDEQYETAFRFGQMPRAGYVGVSLRI